MSVKRFINYKGKYIIVTLIIVCCLIYIPIFLLVANNNPNAEDEINTINSITQASNEVTEIEEEYIMNPLNGTEVEQSMVLSDRNVVAVIIENSLEARPQSGINEADVIYETLVEGGITRFMGVYWSKDVEKIMPVRSSRKYFVELLGDYKDPVFMHIGAAEGGSNTNAVLASNIYKVRDLQTISSYKRDQQCELTVAQEHCAYTNMEILQQEAKAKAWSSTVNTIEKYEYLAKDTILEGGDSLEQIDILFTGAVSDYSSSWKYNSVTNEYEKYDSFGEPFVDANGKQVTTTTLILQGIESYPSGDNKGRIVQNVIGSGRAQILQDGKIYNATWEKDSYYSRTKFFDQNDAEFKFRKGRMWINLIGQEYLE